MKYCSECGAKLIENNVFCPECGKRLNDIKRTEGKDIQSQYELTIIRESQFSLKDSSIKVYIDGEFKGELLPKITGQYKYLVNKPDIEIKFVAGIVEGKVPFHFSNRNETIVIKINRLKGGFDLTNNSSWKFHVDAPINWNKLFNKNS